MKTPITFTSDELRLLHRAAEAVWLFHREAALATLAPDAPGLSRHEVVSLVAGSERLEPAVRRLPDHDAVARKLAVADHTELTEALKGGFPQAKYGR